MASSPITATQVDANTVEVDIPGIGTVVVMRAVDTDTDIEGVKLLWDGDSAKTPTLEPA